MNADLITPTRTPRPAMLVLLALLVIQSMSFGADQPGLQKEGFAVPQPGRKFSFPVDHGSHPEFAVEWWYITGHLTATNGAEYGFQATFFRRSMVPPGSTNTALSTAFGNEQIYLAHMALVDKKTGEFRYQERLNRNGFDAGADTNTLSVHNGNWSLRLNPGTNGSPENFALNASIGGNISFALNFSPKKPMVIFGTNGVSRKAAEVSASSHYLTYPRLAASGTLSPNETRLAVTGEAWMDHEFSSSQLGAGQVGWDWLSLQLNDGRELMAYRMRRQDQATDPFSTVAWVDAQSKVHHVGPDQFKWTVLKTWRSKSGATYPSVVQLEARNPATGQMEIFIIEPCVADQELAGKVGGVRYWEGACRVLDAKQKEIGRAYMELTGYQETLKGRF